MKEIQMVLDADMEGIPLERILKEKLGLTRNQIRSAKFREQGICLNGRKRRVSDTGKAGDVLCVRLEDAAEDTGKVVPVHGNLEILYEDADVIAVYKPGGMCSHPGRGHYRDSLSNFLAGYFQEKGEPALLRSIGRLDRETSGVMVFAKNKVSAARLQEQKKQGIFFKEYLALAKGKFSKAEGEIEEPVGKVPDEQMKMQVSRDGKPAKTFYQVLEENGEETLVRCRIQTGRTHQIRVHLAFLGHPILGDRLYGESPDPWSDLLALHAERVIFHQPFTGERIELSVPPPFSFQKLQKKKEEHAWQ